MGFDNRTKASVGSEDGWSTSPAAHSRADRGSTESAVERECEDRYRSLFRDCPVPLWVADYGEVQRRFEELRNSGIRDLRALLEEDPEQLKQMVAAVRVVDGNEAALALFGACNCEELQEHLYATLGVQAAALFVEQLTALFEGRTSFEASTECHAVDGRPLNVVVRASVPVPFRDTADRVLFSCMDVTQQRQVEGELIKSKKLESIGVLAGGIAHDFNNLLTIILGNINMVQLRLEPDGVLGEKLRRAEQACLRAKDLTHRFMTFSTGGEPVRKVCSIREVLEETAALALTGSSATWEARFSEDLWPVEIDESQIRHVITDIINNAKEAMPQGGIVTLLAENVTLEDMGQQPDLPGITGPYVRVSVCDQGTGIAEEDLDKVFDPYFSTKERGSSKGLGLGLTVAYSIVKRHGGSIQVASTVGRGTTVTFFLPARPPDTVQMKETAPLETVVAKKILVMDDEDLLRKLAEGMLESMDHTVRLARNGEEALEVYREALDSGQPFDLVILDLTVKGGMGGKETMEKLRIMDPNVKAVVSSGYSSNPILSHFEKHGFRGVLVKPYNMKQLEEVLNRVLAG